VLQVNGIVRATRFTVNTVGTEALSINNNKSSAGGGFNFFAGNGGANLNWVSGENASYNIGIGHAALLNITTGQGNVGIGQNALQRISSGVNNSAINGAPNLTTGSNNMAFGAGALISNQNGYNNMSIGTYSLFNNLGSYNVAVGTAALFHSVNSSYNIAVGEEAGNYINSGAGNTTPNNSIYIGYDTRASTSGNQNEIVIGYQGRGNGSNTTTIGNSSTTHTVLQYGKTLIGYSASQDRGGYPLQVNGQIYATNAAIATSDARLKENIEPLPSGLKEVMNLKPCTFDFRKDTGLNLSMDKQVGFIAQDVAATVQGTGYEKALVQEAGGNLALAETKLIPLLVKAIQEQQAQIEALKKEIEQLKNK
jgi:hypothetical protein